MRSFRSGWMIIGAFVLSACNGASDEGTGGATSSSSSGGATGFRAAVAPVLSGCKGSMCHESGAPSGLVLVDVDPDELHHVLLSNAPKRAPDARFVVANDAAQSFLLAKLSGEQDSFVCQISCGDTMPSSPANIETIRAWIESGAPND